MPKSTFFNLPEDKKERILGATIDEFAENSYQNASINKIVKKSDIAKGSFYQYFENKKDLFKYVLEICEERKISYVEKAIEDIEYLDYFEIIRRIYIAFMEFSIENPKLSFIINELLKSNDTELKNEVLEDVLSKSNSIFNKVLERGLQNGNINPNLNIELLGNLMSHMGVFVREYVHKDSLRDYSGLVDEVVNILENGIKFRKRSNRSIEDRFY
ncbi:transcriptional regulator, TetR family [Gottschalkia purinilytica]|uniref:Transcriptional regulator, TetR family n=1 Tax=Gottschalkia purinilytica TaxID=1503 RepID=A0A0L0W916_GOTPU|nr:TetR/AcrR family transcriptional regulator [Gottschalkia purinilytica]KNF07947.1 transcriptional regulator, TetR family [Gottschalkia purinilytica]